MKTGIVAFAFGLPPQSYSNELIARIALRKARTFHWPIFSQSTIIGFSQAKDVYVRFTDSDRTDPIPTLRTARAAVEWARYHELDELWIAAAAPHVRRCKRDLNQAVLESPGVAIRLWVLEEISQCSYNSWFFKGQTHPLSWSVWRIREFILRFMPFWLYKRVAS